MRTLIIGNSDGIGLALTRKLLGGGEDVVGVSRSALDPISDRHVQHVLDVLHPQFPKLLAAIVEKDGPIDTLVYCAGLGEFFETSGVDRDGDIIRVNFAALADAMSAVMPGMKLRGQGRIIGISSIGDRPSPAAPSYGGSKAGMTTYLLGLRQPLAKLGISVSVVRLGFVDTKMAKFKFRPMIITPERAAELIQDVIERGPAIKTYPLVIEGAARLLTALTSWQLRR